MIDKFLKAKHWQIFLITMGLQIVFQIAIMYIVFTSEDFMLAFKLFPIVIIFVMGGYLAWFWSLGAGLQCKVPAHITMKVTRFKIFLIIPGVYMLLIAAGIGAMFSGLFEGGGVPSFGLIGGVIGVVFPLHIFSMFCMFYSLYFVAKTVKTVELQQEVSFSDFAGEFFMLWFYPVGIWIIQPKVNAMVKDKLQ